jgi:hypothetical protein
MKWIRVVAAATFALVSIVTMVSSAGATTKSPVTIRVDLNVTSIRSGHPIHGTALLTNTSDKTIPIQTWECDEWLFVGLSNKDVPYDPAVPVASCSPTIDLKPGVNRFPITVSTDYQSCEMSGTGLPKCPKVGPPLLPKGTYHVDVLTNGLPKGTSFTQRIRVTLH